MLPALILLTCASQLAADGTLPVDLPKPHYHQSPKDPPWLVQAVRFHGHLGPMAVAGVRFGMMGLRAVEAGGFFDVEVTCEGPFAKPPQSCFLDGLQVGTGATLGKRSLHWTPANATRVRVKNTRTGKVAEVRPSSALLELLASMESSPKQGNANDQDHRHDADSPVEAIARKIAAMPDSRIATVEMVTE